MFERGFLNLLTPCYKLSTSPETPAASATALARRARPAISVIIPAHNEEDYLEETLQSVARQDYREREIIVVANGCTDHTAERAQGRCDWLIVLQEKGLGTARNLGARLARGELLVFLDADTIVEPGALRRIVQAFSSRDAAGTLKGQPSGPRLSYRLLYGLKNFVHRWSLHPGSSGVIICWREHFLRSGGFDEGLEVRENSELMKRLKRFGRYRYLGDVTAITSMRRYERRGLGRVVWLWIKLWFESLTGDLHHRSYETIR